MPEEPSISSSYTTAATAEEVTEVVEVSRLSSDDEDEFHTLKDIDDLASDAASMPALLALPQADLEQFIECYNSACPAGQETVLMEDGRSFRLEIRSGEKLFL